MLQNWRDKELICKQDRRVTDNKPVIGKIIQGKRRCINSFITNTILIYKNNLN